MPDPDTTVVRHPAYQQSLERLLQAPGLTAATIKRIRRDVGDIPEPPEQLKLGLGTSDAAL